MNDTLRKAVSMEIKRPLRELLAGARKKLRVPGKPGPFFMSFFEHYRLVKWRIIRKRKAMKKMNAVIGSEIIHTETTSKNFCNSSLAISLTRSFTKFNRMK